jgi:hypothetical protein
LLFSYIYIYIYNKTILFFCSLILVQFIIKNKKQKKER